MVDMKDGIKFSKQECAVLAADCTMISGGITIFALIITYLVLDEKIHRNYSNFIFGFITASVVFYSGIFWQGSNFNGVILGRFPFTFKIIK